MKPTKEEIATLVENIVGEDGQKSHFPEHFDEILKESAAAFLIEEELTVGELLGEEDAQELRAEKERWNETLDTARKTKLYSTSCNERLKAAEDEEKVDKNKQ